MFPGPVFVHELRTVARRRRFYTLRLVFGLFLFYLVFAYARRTWIFYGQDGDDREYSHAELARIGATLHANVLWLQAIAVAVLTPALVAGAIGEDRERKILSYLLASPLTAAEIVLGKLAVRLVNLVMLVLVGLPVVSLALFLGGVDPEGVWLSFAATVSSLYFLAAVCIFVSTSADRPRDAILWAYLLEGLWLFLPVFERWLAQFSVLGEWIVAARPVTEYLTDSSPLEILYDGSAGGNPDLVARVLWMIGLQVLYGTLLIGWSTLRLRAVEQGAALFGGRLLRAGRPSGERRLRERRPCGDNPMLWKECAETFATSSRWKALAMTLIAVAYLAGVTCWFSVYAIPAISEMREYGYGATSPASARQSLNIGVRSFTMFLYPLMALFLSVSAATGFTSERERDTWISLIATPLEGREIIRGKILGAFWRTRWLFAAMLLIWLIGLLCGALHPLGLLASLIATGVYLSAFAALGTYLSLRMSTSARAIATTLGIGMFCNLGYLFCCIPLMSGDWTVVALAGVSPIIVIGSLCSFSEFDWFLNNSGFRPHAAETLTMGIFSLGFYGIAGLKLLHDCLERFQLEVDRPHRGGWPRPEADQKGVRFLPEVAADSEGISFVDEPEDTGGWEDCHET
ncbi:MAG: ABC transporter permease subunit [Isosphaeraceae bacterium]